LEVLCSPFKVFPTQFSIGKTFLDFGLDQLCLIEQILLDQVEVFPVLDKPNQECGRAVRHEVNYDASDIEIWCRRHQFPALE
jgi:hypothetical protein